MKTFLVILILLLLFGVIAFFLLRSQRNQSFDRRWDFYMRDAIKANKEKAKRDNDKEI